MGFEALLEDSYSLIPSADSTLNVHRNLNELEHAASRLAAKGRAAQQSHAEAAT